MNLSTFKAPSAWLPLAMSGAALAVVAGHLYLAHPAPEADEGAAAHMWQLLMAAQLPVIAWFALRWVPKRGKAAVMVLAAQALAAAIALAPVATLGL
jgi:FtsH-binding integral membrane protein